MTARGAKKIPNQTEERAAGSVIYVKESEEKTDFMDPTPGEGTG